jgi:serine/threonine protein kinase
MSSKAFFCPSCGAGNGQTEQRCTVCGQALMVGGQTEATSALGRPLPPRYRLLEKIGEGGFSSVYRAHDFLKGQSVAIKAITLHGLSASEQIEATATFHREVGLLSTLQHRCLPRIHDHFTDTECWYVVMDFIEGTTLEHRLQQPDGAAGPPLSLSETLDLALLLCDTLAYLHGQRPPIIFRDLKPSNIILTPDGHLFLVDFGIARRYRSGQARDTIPFGSPGYAAPEQYGKAQTTPRADIYSLGALLHQLLSGQDPSLSPFSFAPLPDSQPAYKQLNHLIKRMVDMDPNGRPTSIAEVQQQLQSIAQQLRGQSGYSAQSHVQAGRTATQSGRPVPSHTPATHTNIAASSQSAQTMQTQVQQPRPRRPARPPQPVPPRPRVHPSPRYARQQQIILRPPSRQVRRATSRRQAKQIGSALMQGRLVLLSPAAMARPRRNGFAVLSVALGQLGLLAFLFCTMMAARHVIIGSSIEPYSTIAYTLYTLFSLILLPMGIVFGILAANDTRKHPLAYRSYRMAWKGIRLNVILLALYFLLPYIQSFIAGLLSH